MRLKWNVFLWTFVKNKEKLKLWHQKRSFDSLRNHHNCGFQWKKSVTITDAIKKSSFLRWCSGKVNYLEEYFQPSLMSEAKVKSFLQSFVKNKKELKFWNQKRSYDSLRHHHNCGFSEKKSATIADAVKKHLLWCWRLGKVNFLEEFF